MSTFPQYEREWQSTISDVRKVLSQPSHSRTLSTLLNAENLLLSSSAIIAAMYALLQADDTTPNDMISNAKKKKIARLESEVKPLFDEVQTSIQKLEKTELFSTTNNNNNNINNNNNNNNNNNSPYDPFGTKLVETMGDLNSQTSMIADTQRICNDTEFVGANILGTMSTQREQLINANDRVKETRSYAGQARSMLKTMGRRAFFYRIFLYFVILALLAGNCTILYYGYIKKKD